MTWSYKQKCALVTLSTMMFLLVTVLLIIAFPPRARAQTAQENIEKTIGSLVISNATCNQNFSTVQAALEAASKEIADLRAKLVPSVSGTIGPVPALTPPSPGTPVPTPK